MTGASSRSERAVTLLAELLPEYDVRERHSVELGSVPADRALMAARDVTLGELPLARVLFRLRGLPAPSTRPLLEVEGFSVLAEEPGREVVVGAIGRPWTPRGGLRRDVDFRSFAEPGYAKIAFNLLVEHETLSTETRVLATDAGSRRRFRAYWLVVRPFSGLIRRLGLRAARRRALSAESG